MMQRLSAFFALIFTMVFLGAAPRHVQTADYWKGYAGTKNVPADQASQWLSWVETDAPGAAEISPLGVRTILYSNPNRVLPNNRYMYIDEDDTYAHTCGGQRARGESQYSGVLLTNPKSPALWRNWKRYVSAHERGARFDAVFVDEAVGAAYAEDQPCGYDLDDWMRDENTLMQTLGQPTIYNGLNDFSGHGPAKEIALNNVAIGGMMEECYARLRPDHRVTGWRWTATENTEIQMARAHKYFFCYGRDLTQADQAGDSRMYTYASFLLTYDPATTVLWEYYKTPSGGHVMPESQLVALDPVVQRVGNIAQLRTGDGTYVRSYRDCSIAGRSVGPCVAAVNPDAAASHNVDLRAYRRTLVLNGSGVFDGGTIQISNAPPPSSLAPLQAVIAFK
jgi:hypothetical protein